MRYELLFSCIMQWILRSLNGYSAEGYRSDNIGSCVSSTVFCRDRINMVAGCYVSIFRLERNDIVLLGTGGFNTLHRVENLSSIAEDSKENLCNAGDAANAHGRYQIYPIRLRISWDP